MSDVQQEVFLDAASRGARYLRDIPSHRVAPSPEAMADLKRLGGPLSENGEAPADVLALLDEAGSAGTVMNGGGRYFGFVTGAALPAARAANVLAAAWDQNAGLRVMSPVAATLEEIALGWLVELFGLPKDAGGAFVTGATMANFTCLAAARHALLSRAGWNVEADGLFGAPPLTVVVGEEVHVSALKALALLGLGWNRVVKVPTDEQGRMRPDRLPPLDETTILCTQAGNVNTGAFDPFPELCHAAHQAGTWVHVDGAFGIWALASPQHTAQATGVTEADSWATDAHKWLNVPYDCGLAFVRDPAALLNAMTMQPAAYLQRIAEGREPMLWTPEASRRARGIEVWAALRQLGSSGLADLVARCCRHARSFADGFSRAGYSILNDVRLNQVLVAFESDAQTRAVIEGVQREGTCWCGGTTWKGRAAMRVSVSSWATTDADVELSLEAIIRVARATPLSSTRNHDP